MGEIELYAFSDSLNPDDKFSISFESLLMVMDNPHTTFSLLKESILKTTIPPTLRKRLFTDARLMYDSQHQNFWLWVFHDHRFGIVFSVFGDYEMQLLKEARRRMCNMAEEIKEKDEIIERKNREIAELNLLPDAVEYHRIKNL